MYSDTLFSESPVSSQITAPVPRRTAAPSAAPAVAVIGGGIQGVCAALALADAGVSTTIFEAGDALLDRASLRSEGKVHLGFVYAGDPARRTAGLMLDAAMRFAPLLEKWIGPVGWESLRSESFRYVCLPGSLLGEDALRAHYEEVDQLYRERYRRSGLHYLGSAPDRLVRAPESRTPGWLARGTVVADTEEVALDPARFRALLCRAVEASPRVAVRLRHRVEEVERDGGGFVVTSRAGDGAGQRSRWDTVVNCSWSDRLRLDRRAGIEPLRPWVFRLKFRLTGRLPRRSCVPSCTFVLGPFGDSVRYKGDAVYLSWYPAGLRRSEELAPPRSWDAPCRSAVAPEEEREVASAVLRELRAVLPGLGDVRVTDVGAGVIFAWGSRDIDDPASELHARSEIGLEERDGWYSINTGKFTCAPLFAAQLAERVVARVG